jgi:hypothetical protein
MLFQQLCRGSLVDYGLHIMEEAGDTVRIPTNAEAPDVASSGTLPYVSSDITKKQEPSSELARSPKI